MTGSRESAYMSADNKNKIKLKEGIIDSVRAMSKEDQLSFEELVDEMLREKKTTFLAHQEARTREAF